MNKLETWDDPFTPAVARVTDLAAAFRDMAGGIEKAMTSGPLVKSNASLALAKILEITSQCLERLAEIEADLRWLEQRDANFFAAAGGPVKRR